MDQLGITAPSDVLDSADWDCTADSSSTCGSGGGVGGRDASLRLGVDWYGGSTCDDGCDFGCDRCRAASSPWNIGGWIAIGYYDNSHGLEGAAGNSPLGFNNLAEEYQLHQSWVYVGKEAEFGGGGWDWGLRADLLFGSDAPDTQAFGDGSWDQSWDTSNQYGFALPQLYGELTVANTRIKVGHFFTIIGYEVVQATGNFFYSRPYTMYYNEPFTHTGVLAETAVNDWLTVYSGYSFGWDTGFDNRNDGSAFLGGIGLQLSDNLSATYATSFGDPGDSPASASDTYMHSFVVDWGITDRLNYVFQNDFQTRRSAVASGKSYGLNNYLFFQLTDRLAAGGRYEWFRDSRGASGAAGASEHFHAISLGLNCKVSDNMIVKPEMRYDWTDRDDAFAANAFDGGTEENQFTWGSQMIWSF